LVADLRDQRGELFVAHRHQLIAGIGVDDQAAARGRGRDRGCGRDRLTARPTPAVAPARSPTAIGSPSGVGVAGKRPRCTQRRIVRAKTPARRAASPVVTMAVTMAVIA